MSTGNEEFLKNFSEKADVQTTDSGLLYIILNEGSGKTPTIDSNVRVHYAGRLNNGVEFDSSYKRKAPAEFPVNGVIKGWTEMLQLMKEGTKLVVCIPPDLAYGAFGIPGAIPPNAVLEFDIELVKVL